MGIKDKLKAIWSFYRLGHGILIIFAIYLSELIVNAHFSIYHVIAPLFAQMFAFALNDYLDYETDKLNKRIDRPLVSNKLSKKEGLLLIILSLLLAIGFSFFLPFYAMIVVLFFIFLSILYDYFLKDLPFVGNLYIGLTMAIPFIYGNLFSLPLRASILLISLAVMFFGIGREVLKDIEDKEGDSKARGSKSLALLLGKKAFNFAFFFILLGAILFLSSYFLFFKLSIFSLFFIFLTIYYLYLLYINLNNLKRARKLSFYIMVFAILSIFLSLL